MDYQAVIEDTSKQRGRSEAAGAGDGRSRQVIEERPTYDRESGVYTGTTTLRPMRSTGSHRVWCRVVDHSVFLRTWGFGQIYQNFKKSRVCEPDPDVGDLYDSTRQYLKDYLTAALGRRRFV